MSKLQMAAGMMALALLSATGLQAQSSQDSDEGSSSWTDYQPVRPTDDLPTAVGQMDVNMLRDMQDADPITKPFVDAAQDAVDESRRESSKDPE